ncbi:MAG: AIR synthase family protein [Synergistaceae bacterium]|jgi:hydrogenase maturation factor|nr:AIR synthase family protein [Synergistaceae bacterium]
MTDRDEPASERKSTPGPGKLPPEVLKNHVLRYFGARREEVLVGPGLGEDAAVIRWNDASYLVASSDPVVGATDGAGRLLVHINANDIACKGGDPAWFIVTLIVPTENGLAYIHSTMEEIHGVCEELGIAVVGGHTELTDRYERPVMTGTMMGPSRYDLRASRIQNGDVVLVTKHVGLEGMSILAHDRPDLLSFLNEKELEEVRSWQKDLSILKEARLLRDLVRYMHDPTEGGLAGGLLEVQGACGLALDLNVEDIPVSPLTLCAAEKIGFDPLHLISSGVLLAVLPPDNAREALSRLSGEGIEASLIGRFEAAGRRRELKRLSDAHEELWSILAKPLL